VTCNPLPAPDVDTPLLAAALDAHELRNETRDWRDASVDWSDTRFTMLRSPWNYVDALDEFLEWAEHVATVSALWNPLDIIRWNTNKTYLLDLAARGAPIVPTVVLPRDSAASLDGIADAQGWNTVVVKPAVGVGGYGAGRFDVGDDAGQQHLDVLLPEGDVLVQQYAPSIEDDGEMSLLVFDGVASHAVHKRARPGEFRVHEHHGGVSELAAPSAGLVEFGERVVSVLPEPVLYARVDVVAIGSQWHVLEVEATEPTLFLDLAGDSATARLVDAIIARADGRDLYDPGRS
jgi:glutathione synthase/RimK-type ligase-like ATP-grasp enzyme